MKLITDHEKKHCYSRVLMTSWVGNSVTAFLTGKQLSKVMLDPKVRLLTEDSCVSYSANPAGALWNKNLLCGDTRGAKIGVMLQSADVRCRRV